VLVAAPLVVGGCLLMLVPRVDSSALQLALLVFGSGLCGAIYVVCPPCSANSRRYRNAAPSSRSCRAPLLVLVCPSSKSVV